MDALLIIILCVFYIGACIGFAIVAHTGHATTALSAIKTPMCFLYVVLFPLTLIVICIIYTYRSLTGKYE